MDNMEINLEKINQAKEYVCNNLVPMPAYQAGKSLVTSCYRAELPSMFILLTELKRLEFNIPIEIFYRAGELDSNEITELGKCYPSSNVSIKQLQTNARDFTDKWGNVKGWSTKVHALFESSYAENLWIDSDNFPIRNCLDLFNDPEYQSKGSLFWRDVYSIDRAEQYCDSSNLWQIFAVTPNDAEPFESGQILLNKPKVWQQFCLMLHYTENCDIYYSFGGDAECWRMVWQYVAIRNKGYHARFNYLASNDIPYGFMPFGPFHKGVANPWRKYGGGSVMVQRDRSGAELFNHRNIFKFRWQGDNPYNSDIQNESTYHMILRHLKVKYGITDEPKQV
jgi:hypothetical protein